MSTVLNESLAGTPKHGLKGPALEALGQAEVVPAPTSRTARPEPVPCFHCGETCYDPGLTKEEKAVLLPGLPVRA